MNKKIFKTAFNVIGFEAAWFATVAGAAAGMSMVGPVVMVLYIFMNSLISGMERRDLLMIIIAAVAGTIIETVKSVSGLVTYASGYNGIAWIAPIWISALWMGFAVFMNHSMNWLQGRLVIAAVMGAVFGPLSYVIGEKMGGVTFHYPLTVTVAVISVVWGLVFPSMVAVSGRMSNVPFDRKGWNGILIRGGLREE